MKVFILSDPNNVHTKRWVSSLAQKGIFIFLFGLNPFDKSFYSSYKNVQVESVDCLEDLKNNVGDGAWKKLKYLRTISIIKKKIKEFGPDIVHAHYATSYGLLGILSGFHPLIISAWGSDIYCFPKVSFLHRKLLSYNLQKADLLLSTSHVMAEEMHKYVDKKILITPFGVDTLLFKKKLIPKNRKEIIIGTVKTLAYIYGIDILIKAFSIVKNNNPDLNVRLVIAGTGRDEAVLKKMVSDMKLDQSVSFLGKVEHHCLPDLISSFDVFAALSRSESFGVAAVEAMSCECPVVVSAVDGFREVVQDGINGYIVPIEDPVKTAERIQLLIKDKELSLKMGRASRKRVIELYNWSENVQKMVDIYDKVIASEVFL